MTPKQLLNWLMTLWLLALVGNYCTNKCREKLAQWGIELPSLIKPYVAIIICYLIVVGYISLRNMLTWHHPLTIAMGCTAGFLAMGAHDVLEYLDEFLTNLLTRFTKK